MFDIKRDHRGTRLLSILLSISFIFLLTSCGRAQSPAGGEASAVAVSSPGQSQTQTAYPREFKHVSGVIKLDKKPERIYAPYLEDALLALGVTPVLKWSLGELVQDYLEPQLKHVPKIDFAGGPNVETVLAANPDIIILYSSGMASEGAYEKLSQIAPTYVFEEAANDWEQAITVLGDILDRKEQAKQAVEKYRNTVEAAKAKLKPVVEGKTFAVIRVKPKELVLMDGSFFSGLTLYRDLGLTPHPMVRTLAWDNFAPISMEKLPELNADYLFYMIQGTASQAMAKDMMDSAIWKGLPAVKAGHAFEVSTGHWLAAGAIANTMQVEDVIRSIKP